MVKPALAIVGPRDAGPGERQEMLERAHRFLEEADGDDLTRIDVPGTSTGSDEGRGVLRPELDHLVPALQSGSLFGGKMGVLVVDAQNLLKAEADAVAGLLGGIDEEVVAVVFVAAGSIPSVLAKAVDAVGETVRVKKYRERDASGWITKAARERGITLSGDAGAVLLQRFGSDLAALGQALDQLAVAGEEITAAGITGRFRSRPDEPMWHYGDAITNGDVGEALRRLSDFLAHGHPLQLLAFIESDIRRRSLAASAPDLATFAEWIGAAPDSFPIRKAWQARHGVPGENLHHALRAVARADLHLKTTAETSHRVTMERLTVALARWLGQRRVTA